MEDNLQLHKQEWKEEAPYCLQSFSTQHTMGEMFVLPSSYSIIIWHKDRIEILKSFIRI